jgi:hypothetical protein
MAVGPAWVETGCINGKLVKEESSNGIAAVGGWHGVFDKLVINLGGGLGYAFKEPPVWAGADRVGVVLDLTLGFTF